MFSHLIRKIGWLSMQLTGYAKSDPVFGKIRFFRSKVVLPEEENSSFDSFQYWEAFRSIAPASPVRLIHLPSPRKNGPAEAQRDIYLELRTRYQDLFPEMVLSVSRLMPELKAKTAIEVENLANNLDLDHVTIEHPNAYPDRLRKQDIELNYRLLNSSLKFLISIQNWKTVAIEIWDIPIANNDLPATLIISA